MEQPSAGKIMATIYWDAKGTVVVIDYFKREHTITR